MIVSHSFLLRIESKKASFESNHKQYLNFEGGFIESVHAVLLSQFMQSAIQHCSPF